MGTKHFSEVTIAEILQLRKEAYTYREIGECVGLSQNQIKKFFERRHRREREIAKGYTPKPKGRPKTKASTPEDRIKELEREVELLRAFLRAAGRM